MIWGWWSSVDFGEESESGLLPAFDVGSLGGEEDRVEFFEEFLHGSRIVDW